MDKTDPTPRTWRHRLILSGRIHDDSVLVVYGLAGLVATYADEGMIGVSWTDMQHDSDPTIFLVQQGRLYLAKRHEAPRHATLDGAEAVPWQPFPTGDPENGR